MPPVCSLLLPRLRCQGQRSYDDGVATTKATRATEEEEDDGDARCFTLLSVSVSGALTE